MGCAASSDVKEGKGTPPERLLDGTIEFATSRLQIEECLFDSYVDDADSLRSNIAQNRSIFLVCKATDGDTYCGYMSNYSDKHTNYQRDDEAWVGLSATQKVYKSASPHTHDVYNAGEAYGPTWGAGHVLYIGNLQENFAGAYAQSHASYEGSDFGRKSFTPMRIAIFAAVAIKDKRVGKRGGFNELFKRCEWHSVWTQQSEAEALKNCFHTARPPKDKLCIVTKKDVKNESLVERMRSFECAHTLIVQGSEPLQELPRVKTPVPLRNFSVLELRGIPSRDAYHVVSLLQNENKLFDPPVHSVRFAIKTSDDFDLVIQVLQQRPPHLHAIELTPNGRRAFSVDTWNTIASAFGVYTLPPTLKFCILNSECPRQANINLAIKAAALNPDCSFDWSGEPKERHQLTPGGDAAFASAGLHLPAIVPFGEVDWAADFGLVSGDGVVRCDRQAFLKHAGGPSKEKAQQSSSSAVATPKPGDAISMPSPQGGPVRCPGISASSAAYQFVALYLTATDATTGKPLFVSDTATMEAKDKSSRFFLSPSDERFGLLVKAHVSGSETKEFALWTDMMAIATFLNIYALVRLVRSSIVNSWLFDRSGQRFHSSSSTNACDYDDAEIPESVEFITEHLSEIGDCLFDSIKDPSNQINTKIGSHKSILVICEATDGEIYCGFTTKFDTVTQGNYVRDDDAFVAMKSTQKLYRPSSSHQHDVYCYASSNYGPTWGGGHILYLGNINSNWAGAYSNPHNSYDGCDFTRRNFVPKRVQVFEATKADRR